MPADNPSAELRRLQNGWQSQPRKPPPDEMELNWRERRRPLHACLKSFGLNSVAIVLTVWGTTYVARTPSCRLQPRQQGPQSRRTKNRFTDLKCPTLTQHRGDTVRHDNQPIDESAQTTEFTFHFQMSNGGGRQACSVKVQAHNAQDATRVFRQNWPTIEIMARDSMAKRCREDGNIIVAIP
jgi:hypothetical protein